MLESILCFFAATILIMMLFGYLYYRLQKVELDFRIFQAETKTQLRRIRDTLNKPIVQAVGPTIIQEAKSVPHEATASLWSRLTRMRSKIASDRLMPTDLFDAQPLWRRVFARLGLARDDFDFLHALCFLILIGCLTWGSLVLGQSSWGDELTQTWGIILRAVVPTIGLLGVLLLGHFFDWPFQRHYRGYYWLGCGALALYLWVWSILAHFFGASVMQFKYHFFLNPLDLIFISVFIGLALWIYGVQLNIKKSRFTVGWGALILTLLLWLGTMGLRKF